MKKLVQDKALAISLRKKGLSYNEILLQVPVAKSSLSLWLKDLPLTRSEKQLLKTRTDSSISRGRIKAASELRKQRLDREQVWVGEAKDVFSKYAHEPLFHAGIAMYWAEGAKTSNRWMLINTDADVIVMMIKWLKKYCQVDSRDVHYRLFIHRPYADGRCEAWWQSKLEVSVEQFLKTVYKDTVHKTKQKSGHQGCLRIEVVKSKRLFFFMKVFKNLAVESYKE